MKDVTYRNAMAALSARGWRVDEPGEIGPMGAPNLLGQAVERLTQHGIGLTDLADDCHLPSEIVHDLLKAASEDALPGGFMRFDDGDASCPFHQPRGK
jgi:hypothetical protein